MREGALPCRNPFESFSPKHLAKEEVLRRYIFLFCGRSNDFHRGLDRRAISALKSNLSRLDFRNQIRAEALAEQGILVVRLQQSTAGESQRNHKTAKSCQPNQDRFHTFPKRCFTPAASSPRHFPSPTTGRRRGVCRGRRRRWRREGSPGGARPFRLRRFYRRMGKRI
jgi:hypothetical protein